MSGEEFDFYLHYIPCVGHHGIYVFLNGALDGKKPLLKMRGDTRLFVGANRYFLNPENIEKARRCGDFEELRDEIAEFARAWFDRKSEDIGIYLD